MRKQTLIAILAVVLIAGGTLSYWRYSRPPKPVQAETPSFVTASLSVDGILQKTDVAIPLDSTALSLLSEVAKEMPFELSTKEYPGMGVLVEKIGDVQNGEGGKYWHYYINGKLAPVGASDYVVQPNDDIEWKFTEPDTSY